MDYRPIARYYDLVHEELTADIGFALTLAAKTVAKPGAGPILELGCGTGRLLLPLARAGMTVVGLDNEPAMLDQARLRLATEPLTVQQRVTLVAGDMTDFDLAGPVSMAIIAYNTFMHLDRSTMRQTLRCLARYLQSDGRLLLDLANPIACAQTPDDRALTLEQVLVDPEDGRQVLQMASSWVNREKQILHITWIFDANPVDGGSIDRVVGKGQYHYLYPHEIELLLQSAGMELDSLYGGYNLVPFGEDSERLLVVGKIA